MSGQPHESSRIPDSLTAKALAEWNDDVRELSDNSEVKVIVLTGAGIALAAACDIRLASPETVLSAPFVKLGITGDLGLSWFLPRIIGLPKAADMILNSREYDAEQARRYRTRHRHWR